MPDPTPTLLSYAMKAMRLTNTAYETEITRLIDAACADLGIAGITATASTAVLDPILMQAVITYCRLNFGSPADYDRLKASYDEQKAQLQTATGYGL